MTATLTTTELRGALQVAGELAALRELSQFPRCAVRAVSALIPCDHAGYNEIDLDSGRATVIAEPAEIVFDGGAEALARLGHQNPIIVRAQNGEETALRLSDFITRRELHRTELYCDVYRPIGLEYQLALRLPAPRRELGRPREIVGISLARMHSDFSSSEQLLLELLKPHFAATLERLHEQALARAALAHEARDDDRYLLLIDAVDGTIAWAERRSQIELGVRIGAQPPAELRRQLAQERVVLAERRFTARLVPDAYPGLDALHLAPERSPDVAQLRALGLTPRQAEVHALAMRGQTSRQIAAALVLSPRTVEKHVEAIYARLGVCNRTEAVVATLSALDHKL